MDEVKQCMCIICGAQTQRNAKHYGVEGVCQPCALFFGRTSNKNLKFVCNKDESCRLFAMRHQLCGSMHLVARTACKSCRLLKCYEMGMRNEKMLAQQQLLGKIEPESSLELDSPGGMNVHSLLRCLGSAEARCQILYGKACILTGDLPRQLDSMRELLSWNANLVEETCKITEVSPESAQQLLSAVCAGGNFTYRAQPQLINMISITDSFKSMPFFRKIDINDQICLLNYVGGALFELYSKYFSASQNSEIVIFKHPVGISPLFVYQSERYRGDEVVKRLSSFVFHSAMEPFNRVRLDETEFLFLKVISACHPATSGLSAHAIDVLQSEMERYASLLMRLLQQRFDGFAAAKRYAEIMHLAELAFRTAFRMRELMTYVAMVTDQGKFHAKMPRAFINMCLHGKGTD